MGSRRPFEGALHLTAEFVCPVPPSWVKSKQEKALTGELASITKPDLDNQLKLVLDSLNGVVYVDDRQIVQIIARKSYGRGVGTSIQIILR
jgi:Holliday junction resolvase RusA-like endonuclease